MVTARKPLIALVAASALLLLAGCGGHAGEPSPTPGPRAAIAEGYWDGEFTIEGQTYPVTLHLEQNGDVFQGRVQSDVATGSVQGAVEGLSVGFRISYNRQGCAGTLTAHGELVQDRTRMNGHVSVDDVCAGTATGIFDLHKRI